MLTRVNTVTTDSIWSTLTGINFDMEIPEDLKDIYLAKIDVLAIIIKYVLEQDLDNAN